MISVKPYLDQLESETKEIILFIKTEVTSLTDEQLSLKPDSKSWSILECLEHMNISTRHYVDIIEEKIPKALTEQQNPVNQYKRGFLGKLCINSISPTDKQEIKSKMKTLSKFKPLKALDKGKSDVTGEFIRLNKTLLDQITKARKVNVNKIRIKSGIGGLIRFKLADAFGFVVGHNQRHIIQIKKLLEASKQPLKTEDKSIS